MKHKVKKHQLPPEGLWVSPDGKHVSVTEHLLALQHYPETFGLPESTRKADIPVLRDLAEGLIRDGWVRFRHLAGTYAFEVDNAKRRIDVITDILTLVDAFVYENVTISQVKPLKEFQGTVADVYDRKVFGYQENPAHNRWRFTQGLRHALLSLAVILAGCTCAAEPQGKAWVASTPAGAAIFTVASDGAKADTGKKTPALLYMPLGDQRVELILAGYAPATMSFKVDGQAIRKPPSENLVQAKVAVDILFADGDGFAVYVDGKPVKDAKGEPATTPCTIDLSLGQHALVLAKDGYLDVAQKLDVKDATAVEIKQKPSKGTSTLLGTIPTSTAGSTSSFSQMLGTWKSGKDEFTLSLGSGQFVLTEGSGVYHSLKCVPAKDKLIFQWSSSGDCLVMMFSNDVATVKNYYKLWDRVSPNADTQFPENADRVYRLLRRK